MLYFVIHLPLDLYMMRSRDRSMLLIDYGINSSDRMNMLLGVFSLGMWFSWLLFAIASIHKSVYSNLTPFFYRGTFSSKLQVIGMLAALLGVLIASWGRIARGPYAASWGLNETIPLITHGPFHYVRHPSYLFYMIMFLSLPLITLFLPLILLLPGIWTYSVIATDEERLLERHFGEAYRNYQKHTGKFLPRFKN